MNKTTSVVDAQLQHLLEVVERNRDERCRALLAEARTQARLLVEKAHREARVRLHQKVLETREKVRLQLASAQAQRETRLRLQRHRADRALLTRTWQPLTEKMLQRWRQADARQLWIDNLVEQASTLLVDRNWHIEHPLDWPASERAELEARLGKDLGSKPGFAARAEIEAGLRICAGAACVDGTLEGLLRDRSRIEALLLATLNECRRKLAAEARPDSHEQSP